MILIDKPRLYLCVFSPYITENKIELNYTFTKTRIFTALNMGRAAIGRPIYKEFIFELNMFNCQIINLQWKYKQIGVV